MDKKQYNVQEVTVYFGDGGNDLTFKVGETCAVDKHLKVIAIDVEDSSVSVFFHHKDINHRDTDKAFEKVRYFSGFKFEAIN